MKVGANSDGFVLLIYHGGLDVRQRKTVRDRLESRFVGFINLREAIENRRLGDVVWLDWIVVSWKQSVEPFGNRRVGASGGGGMC